MAMYRIKKTFGAPGFHAGQIVGDGHEVARYFDGGLEEALKKGFLEEVKDPAPAKGDKEVG